MDLRFVRGDAGKPKGHALVYFASQSAAEIWATYLIVLPITVDVTKYVPPFLMNQMGGESPKDLGSFAFPPSPEKIPDRGRLEELAEIRDDDIIDGGSLDGDDIASAMMRVNELLQGYSRLCSGSRSASIAAGAEEADGPEEIGVTEVLYGLMTESDRLGELTKLIGRLRFAVDGGEDSLVRETEEEIGALSRHLPDTVQVPKMVAAVKSADERGAVLADLYLKRSFHLVHEQFAELGGIERQIESLEAEGGRERAG